MIEKELKCILSKDQYEKVRDVFMWDDNISQLNLYYDNCNGKIKSINKTVRIRVTKNNMKLQVKIPLDKNNGRVHCNAEFEKKVDIVPYVISAGELNELCTSKEFRDVNLLGFLSTERLVYNMIPEIEIALDVNNYLGVEDYELEIEFKNEISKELWNKLSFLDIDINSKAKGKFTRFREKYYSLYSDTECTNIN